MVINKHFRKILHKTSVRRWSRRTAVLVAGVVAAVLLLGGGSYALFWGGSSSGATNSPVNLSKGLVGWWKFNNNFNDSTPNRSNCTNLYGASGFTTDRLGVANNALDPSGLGLDCGLPAVLQLSSAVSMSAWVKPTSFNSAGSGIASYGGVYMFYFNTNGTLKFAIKDNSYGMHTVVSPTAYTANNWYFVTVTFDGTTIRLYVNGTQVASTPYTGTLGTALYSGGDFIIAGYNTNSTNSTFIGPMNDVRVYSRALSTAEVTALYGQANPGSKAALGEKGLVGWWKLNGNLNDSTPARNNAVMEYGRSPGFTSDRKGAGNGAQSFNGGNDCNDVGAASLFPATDFTINVWVNNSSILGSNLNMFGQYDSGPIAPTIKQSSGSGQVSYQLWSADGTTQYTADISNLFTDTGKWSMITWTKSGSTLNFYKNGQLIQTGTGPAGKVYIDTGQSYKIGCSHNYWAGAMSDFRIYDRAISTQEISNLYNSYNSQLSIGGDGQPSGINLQKGLVGHWAMDNNVNDSTPYRTVCTPPTSSPFYGPDRMGRTNSAASLPKLGMDCGQPTALAVPNLTMSAWVNASSINTGGNGIEAYGGTTQLFINTSSYVFFTLHDSTNAAHTFASTGTIPLNQWYFVAVTYDGSNVNIYINGALDTSTGYTGGIGVNHYDDTGNDFMLGNFNSASTGRSFKGLLDDVRIYNRPLNANEIKALYNEYQ